MRKSTNEVIKYFYNIVRHEKPIYILYMIIVIAVTAVLPFVNIVFPKYLIEELAGNKNISIVIYFVLTIVLLNCFGQAILYIFKSGTDRLNDWFQGYFRVKISKRSMCMDFEHMENPKVLDQVEKAKEGMWFYSGGLEGLTQCLSQIISSAITVAGVVFIISATSPLLLLVAVLAVILSSFIVRRVNKLEIETFNKGPEINRGFGYIFAELGQAKYGKDIRLYRAQEMLMKFGRDNLNLLYRTFKHLHDGTQAWNILNTIVSGAKSIGIYLCLGFLAWKKTISVGDFMMLAIAANSFEECLHTIVKQTQELQKKTNFMNEYKKFMEYEDALEHGDREIYEMSAPVIECRNLKFRYPGSNDYILKNVNLTIKSGEHLSIVGLNGAGKTTFVKLLCHMYDPEEGEILINGVNIKEYKQEEYMKLLSVVFQDFKLFAMSMEDNIRLGDWDKEKTDLSKLCEISGLSDKVSELPDGVKTMIYKNFDKSGIEPSGGEAQKMALARALYKNAPIVILDEPTAALDPLAEYDIYKRFDTLVGGKTAVYISHRLSSCKFCDKIAVFSGNNIAEYGTHEELINKGGIYEEMFRAQAQYYV